MVSNVTEGFYKATVADVYINTEKPNQVIFKLVISEGDCTGATRTTRMLVPRDANDNVRYYWRAAMESAGYSPAQIDSGELALNRDMFLNRQMLFYYRPGDKDAGIYEELNFLPPTEWAQRSSTFVPSAAPVSEQPRRTRTTVDGSNASATKGNGVSESLAAALNGTETNGNTSVNGASAAANSLLNALGI
jgi:hypothetical protein